MDADAQSVADWVCGIELIFSMPTGALLGILTVLCINRRVKDQPAGLYLLEAVGRRQIENDL
jgi:hypothetical protein